MYLLNVTSLILTHNLVEQRGHSGMAGWSLSHIHMAKALSQQTGLWPACKRHATA
jgi:hypothetical protein